VDVQKLILDYRIPPQHNIQFYLKARKPDELEAFFNDSTYYLSKLIRRAEKQLEHLSFIKSDAHSASKYERRNYMRFLGATNNGLGFKEYKENLENESNINGIKETQMLKNIQIQNQSNAKQMQSEIRILKAIDDHINANKYSKFNLTAEQKQELNGIRKAEILRNALKEKAQSEADIVHKYQASQAGDAKIYFHKHNENSALEGFDLTYSQKMLMAMSKNATGSFATAADASKEQLHRLAAQMKNIEAERKIVGEITKRQKIQDSLRRRKRYHLAEVKQMKTSLDKYADEDEYYLVRSFKESGVEINKSVKEGVKAAKALRALGNQQQNMPKI